MQALLFLLDSVVSFFCALFLLRFLMQALRVSFAGQIGDVVVRLTDWAVKPLRRAIPGFGGFDWASVVAALALQLALSALIVGLFGNGLNHDGASIVLMAFWFAIRALLRLTIYLFIGALILQAVLSWVNPHSPVAYPVNQLTRPLLAPFRRIIPPISGIDLSPLVVILLLQALLIFL